MEWISVNERLPEIKNICADYKTSEDILLLYSDLKFSIGNYGVDNNGNEFWSSDGYSVWDVVYWIPLPKLPKENDLQ